MNQENFHPPLEKHQLHVGIIPDGGRRWATIHNKSLQESYAMSRKMLALIVKHLLVKDVNEISLYLSSRDNYLRPPHEIQAIHHELNYAVLHDLERLATTFQLKIVHAGDPSFIDHELASNLEMLKVQTEQFSSGSLNLCIAYNPLDELHHAMKQSQDIETLTQHLWVTNPLDLIIRTGDANLLSNFLPLQAGYARIYFSNKLFNDLLWEDVESFLNQYNLANRKYGT